MTRVLFVCLGNICRSPLAEGVFRRVASEAGLDGVFEVASAGTYAYHRGQGADRRAVSTALAHGVDLRAHRARPVDAGDFETFDHIVAMDRQNQADLLEICPRAHRGKVSLLLEHAPELGLDEVPDPYYGGADGFEHVFTMIERSCRSLLENLRPRRS